MKEGRHARPSEIVIGEVTDATLCCLKKSDAAGETALFVTYAPDGKLRAYVRYYLEALSHNGIRPVLIVASDKEVCEVDGAFLSRLDGFYVRQNLGYDFGAWAHILRDDPNLLNAGILYLINDSTIGPINNRKFEELLLRVRSSTKDLIGLTDSYERQWHIQSYFLALKGSALSSPALRSFFGRIMNLSAKNDVTNAYEIPFATFLENGGLSCEVLFPAKKAHNPTLAEWRALLRVGLPFVKLAALRKSSHFGDKIAWRSCLQAEGFDYRLAEEALSSRP